MFGLIGPEFYGVWKDAVDLFRKDTAGAPRLGLLSVFNGVGNMVVACSMLMIASGGVDILNHPVKEDILNLWGIHHTLMLVCRLERGATLWMGPPCCSWIWLTRSKSKRTRRNPEGLGWRDSWVHYHNRIAACVAAIAEQASRLGVYWVIEQPASSVLFDFPLVKSVIANCNAASVSLNLGDFGGTSLKPLRLVGTAPWLLSLPLAHTAAPRTRPLQALSTRDADGRVTGTHCLPSHMCCFTPLSSLVIHIICGSTAIRFPMFEVLLLHWGVRQLTRWTSAWLWRAVRSTASTRRGLSG